MTLFRQPSRRSLCRRPVWFRPILETLEDRTLLSMAAIAHAAQLDAYGPALGNKQGALSKVGYELAQVYEAHRAGLDQASFPAAALNERLLKVSRGQVLLNAIATADTPRLRADLQRLGFQPTGTYGRMVSGWLPDGQIAAAAGLQSLLFAEPAYQPQLSVGAVTSQGDHAMGSDQVRSVLGLDGSGVTVGVLSDSFNLSGNGSYLNDIKSGDLPPGVNVLQDDPLSNPTDEGRAMLQIVHDVAPGAGLAFHTAQGGDAAFAQGILDLAVYGGAKVIVDDVSYPDEPMFQDGVVAQAVNLVESAGVAYFTSAGNNGRYAYESSFQVGNYYAPGTFGPSFYGGYAHNFNTSGGYADLQAMHIPTNQPFELNLQWNNPYASAGNGSPGAGTDLDVYLFDSNLNIVASSTMDNIGHDPTEVLGYFNNTSSTTFYLAIMGFSGTPPSDMKYVVEGDGLPEGPLNYVTNSGTLFGHANTIGAMAVGAAAYWNTPAYGTSPAVQEPYSSAGPTPVYFAPDGTPYATPQLLGKPNIVAPDNVDTTFFGQDTDGNGYPNFAGTSAAAPHAAAVAALMLQANHALTPFQIYGVMEATAADMGISGPDYDTGYGLLQAAPAVATVAFLQGSIFTPSNVVEGQATGNVVLANFTDPMGPDGVGQYSALITWGDGTTSAGTIFALGNGSFNVLGGHTYADEGSYPLSVGIFDSDGSHASGSTTVNVADAPLSASAQNLAALVGTSTGAITVGTFTDLGGPELGTYSATITWGDGSSGPGTIVLGNNGTFLVQGSHIYAAAGSYPVGVAIVHENGITANVSGTAIVTYPPPTAFLFGPANGVVCQPRPFTLAAIDLNPANQTQPFTFTINWGDGTQTVTSASPASVAHLYAATGTYTVSMTATDKDGLVSAPVTSSITIGKWQLQGSDLAVSGTTGNDSFVFSPGANPGDLQVTINGVSQGTFHPTGQVLLFGCAGNDAVTINGTTGNDTFVVGTASMTFNGLPFSGTGTFTWKLAAQAGNDTFDHAGGTAVLDGGTGTDSLVGSDAGTTYVVTGNGTGKVGSVTFSAMENLVGGNGSDTLVGPNTAITWTLNAVNGGQLNSMTFSGMENLKGGTGTDAFTILAGGGITGLLDGGGNPNSLDYSSYGCGLTINLQMLTAPGTGGFTHIQALIGSTASDTLVGANVVNNWQITGPNAATIGGVSFTGFENLTGGSVADNFIFADTAGVTGIIDGGGGGNTLNYAAYITGVNVNLTSNVATGTGGIANIQNVTGGSGNDNLTGNSADNILMGGPGNDIVNGGSGGHDILVGGDGNDSLTTGPNRSILIGSSGNDTLHAGGGDDLLIAGLTLYDTNATALAAIMNEWKRTDETYAQRISNLRGTTSGGLNGSYLLKSTTVFDDAFADSLTGGAGSDWFWYNPAQDTITDLQNGEQTN
jgi:Ca2+-binding RTX toxin-like protein